MADSRLLRNALLTCLTVMASWTVARVQAAPSAPVPVGVARIDITPGFPVRMYGYAARKAESEGIAGPLTAKALVIGSDDADGPAVLLTVDCGAVPEGLYQQVFERITSKTKVAPERFVLCNSHCHSGPDLKGMDSIQGEQHERLARYARQLADRLELVVNNALASRQPGRLALARGTVKFAANRRVLKEGKWAGFGAVPQAPVDHSLPVLKVTAEDGRILALVVNYACHNTTLRGDFPQVHGDWAGCAQQYIEADQPGVVALISIGCGADSDPCPHGTVDLCEQHGRELADEVQRLVANSWTPVTPTISARRTKLQISLQQNPDLDRARDAAKQSYPVQTALARIDQGKKLPDSKTYQIVTWTFGNDLAMVFLSDEVVVDFALRLQRELDASRLWITAYAQDVSTYIVSRRLIDEGGYEVRNSLSSLVTFGQPETLRPAMEDRIIDRVKAMLPSSFHQPKAVAHTVESRPE